jgi:predicted regulator of Ras-like GTPase activity (Roadblock/LC7/MglB family)
MAREDDGSTRTSFSLANAAPSAPDSRAEGLPSEPKKASRDNVGWREVDMAVSGDLRDMPLTTLISVNCNEYNQSRLHLWRGEQEAVVFFDEGQIAHMTLGDQQGEEVIYELLTWEEGRFELEMDVPPPARTVNTPWSNLVLDGMRLVDEDAARWEVEWGNVEAEEAKQTRDETAERLARDLKRIADIEGVLICSQRGQVLGQNTNGDPVKEAALTAFVGYQAEALGVLLNAGRLKQVVLAGEKWRAMVVAHEQSYVGLSLARRTSDSVAQAIQTTLRRYRQVVS